jgi:hypothetical protein
MLLFKASGQTYPGVVAHRRHAFRGKPQTFHSDELVLLSKNKSDCVGSEKQVQYVGKLVDIRKPISADEFELYWPGSNGAKRWNYVAELYSIRRLDVPFSLNEIRDFDWKHYNAVQCYAVFREPDAARLTNHLVKVNPNVVRELINIDGNLG